MPLISVKNIGISYRWGDQLGLGALIISSIWLNRSRLELVSPLHILLDLLNICGPTSSSLMSWKHSWALIRWDSSSTSTSLCEPFSTTSFAKYMPSPSSTCTLAVVPAIRPYSEWPASTSLSVAAPKPSSQFNNNWFTPPSTRSSDIAPSAAAANCTLVASPSVGIFSEFPISQKIGIQLHCSNTYDIQFKFQFRYIFNITKSRKVKLVPPLIKFPRYEHFFYSPNLWNFFYISCLL